MNKTKSDTIKKVLEHFRKSDPVLYQACLSIRALSVLEPSLDHFSALCETIVNQQLSEKAGATIFARFKNLFPNGRITPEHLTSLPDDKIRSVGSSWGKVRYLKNLARAVVSKELELGLLQTLDHVEVVKILTKIKGIGPWTAEMFLMFSLAHEDIFSSGDLGLRNAIKKLYKFKKDPTKKQMEKLSKKWVPYRTYACLILWRSLEL